MKKIADPIIWMTVIAALLNPVLISATDTGNGPSFAIYPANVKASQGNQGSLDTLPLANQPLLTDADIIEYRWNSHKILLSEQGIRKLGSVNKQDMRGTLFVVVANGERCYQGAFWSMLWSSSYSYPVIALDVPDVKKTINVITIERAYPNAEFAEGDDPRNDDRVLHALKQAGKLK